MNQICVIGNDQRSNYLRKLYQEDKVKLVDMKEADIIIASIPFSRDGVKLTNDNLLVDEFLEQARGKMVFSGVFSEEVKKKMEEKSIVYYDVMKLDELAVLNAIPTCEGAIYEAIKNSDITLCHSCCMVMGFGRIGKILAKMLQGIGAQVYCEARKQKDLAFIEAMGYNKVNLKEIDKALPKMDFIFNTIPVTLLNEEKLKKLSKDCLIIDLASSPGGVDFEQAKRLGVSVVWALSLPSKVAPKTAANYLKDCIDTIIDF